MLFTIVTRIATGKRYVQIAYTFDKWQDEDYIYDAPIDGIIQCLEEKNLVKLNGDESIKVIREYISDYFDDIYDWFYEDAYDEWASSDNAPSF